MDEKQIENAVSPKTKAVLLTNLYGQCSNLQAIRTICDKHGLRMIEDCAQSHGASFGGRRGGTVGDISCFSFYPTKPLGAYGDAGAIVTDSVELAERVRMLRNYGSKKKYINEECGVNSRIDEIQAAMLRVSLSYLDKSNAERIAIAKRYLTEVKNSLIELPKIREGADHVFHIFAVRTAFRDEIKKYLLDQGIQTQIHYPIPPHKAECYKDYCFDAIRLPNTERFAKIQLSLPIYCGMPTDEVDIVIDALNSFPGRR